MLAPAKAGTLMLYFTSFLSLSIFAFPDSVLREKVHKSSSFNAACLAPNRDPFTDCGWCSAYRFSCESAFAPFSIGTEFLPLSSLNPPIPHISVGRLFNFQGARKFNLPYIPRHKKSQIFQKNKNFLKIFSLAKKTKK